MASRDAHSNPIAGEIVKYGELAYSPDMSAETRPAHISQFNHALASMKTLTLMPVLTALVQPGRAQPWLQPHLAHALALLPMRPRGVRSTLEFILLVHQNAIQRTGSSQPETPESRGPSITLEALNSASRLLSSPPSGFSPELWFSSIAPQLLALLDGEGGLEMIKAAAFIIGYGILGRKALGAPGAVGWNAFAEPLLSSIDPTIASRRLKQDAVTRGSDTVVLLANPRYVIVTASKVAEALRRLASLLSSHPNPGLSRRLLDPLLLPLWALSSWPLNKVEGVDDEWRPPATFLLQILLKLASDGAHLLTIAQNLLFQGNKDNTRQCWIFVLAPGSGIQIEESSSSNTTISPSEVDLEALDIKINAFIELVRPLIDIDDVPILFLALCKKWLLRATEPVPTTIIMPGQNIGNRESSHEMLVEGKLMQKLMTALPGRLVNDSTQIVELASEVLDKALHSGEDLDGDETVTVALSLLNLTFTAPSFSKEYADRLVKEPIKLTLEHISQKKDAEASITAGNLLLLLKFTANHHEPSTSTSMGTDRSVEDRKTYSLALSYIRAADSPPPVRAEGLDLISGLIASSSPMLDIPATFLLLSSLLQDDEEYIFLRAIKAFISLSIKHPKAVILELLEHYLDLNEELSLDSRLRTGEALLQVVQKAGQTFTGDLARQVGEDLLSTAGRRGHRPKTEAQHRKNAELAEKKQQEAERAWDGPVPQLEDSDSEKEDPILAQIVSGWDSQKGTEDIRIRASALSILGTAIETNISGLGTTPISNALDLCINILALEPSPAEALLRRAAILLIMSLLRALDTAQSQGKKPGFGFAGQNLEDVLRILRYVRETDNDGLVRRHAEDVIEGLEAWRVKGLLGAERAEGAGLGLVVGLEVGLDAGGRGERPRIEVVE